MKFLSNFVPSAKICSFIMLVLCLWQVYVFYHVGFARGEAYAIATMMNSYHNTPAVVAEEQNQ